jgi:hypothetical protein
VLKWVFEKSESGDNADNAESTEERRSDRPSTFEVSSGIDRAARKEVGLVELVPPQ